MSETPSPARSKSLRVVLVALAVAVAGAAGAGGWYFSRNASLNPEAIHTVAVLPFDNPNPGSGLGDLGDGIVVMIGTSLSSAESLRVIDTASSLMYKVRMRTLGDVRSMLAAEAALQGRFVLEGETITIDAWLDDTASGKRLWSKTVSGQREATFALADSLARDLGRALGRPVRSQPVQASSGWQDFLYLLESRRLMVRIGQNDVNKAYADLNRILDKNPEFVPALNASAELHGRLTMLEYLTRQRATEEVGDAVAATLEVNPDSAEAYCARGLLKVYVLWDWAGGAEDFQKALSLRPSYSLALHGLGLAHQARGRSQESLDAVRQAFQLDPFSEVSNLLYAYALIYNRNYDEALTVLDGFARANQEIAQVFYARAFAHFGKGDMEGARFQLKSMWHFREMERAGLAMLGPVEARSGNVAEARQTLKQLEALATDKRPVDPVMLAGVYLALGEERRGYQLLAEGMEAHAVPGLPVQVSPLFAAYRDDPRFQAILAKAKMRP